MVLTNAVSALSPALLFNMTTEILHLCWSEYLVNAIVVWPPIEWHRNEQVIPIYTYFPYDSMHCERVQPVLWNYVQNGRFGYERNLFPSKLNQMYKCPVSFAIIDFYPYTIGTKFANGSIAYDGIDITVSQALASQLNFTRIVRYPVNREDRGIVCPNKTVTGALGLVWK